MHMWRGPISRRLAVAPGSPGSLQLLTSRTRPRRNASPKQLPLPLGATRFLHHDNYNCSASPHSRYLYLHPSPSTVIGPYCRGTSTFDRYNSISRRVLPIRSLNDKLCSAPFLRPSTRSLQIPSRFLTMYFNKPARPPPPSSSVSKQGTLSFTNKPPATFFRPGPAKTIPPSGVNTLASRAPLPTPPVSSKSEPSQRPPSSLGKRHADSHQALRRAMTSASSFDEPPVKHEDDKAPLTRTDSLKQAVHWEEDDFEFDDDDLDELVELGVASTTKKPPVPVTPAAAIRSAATSSSSANAWKRQFMLSPETAPSTCSTNSTTSIQKSVSLQFSEPAQKKRRTLPWKAKEEAEKKAREDAELASILPKPFAAPAPVKSIKSESWTKTITGMTAPRSGLKGMGQKRAISTSSLGPQTALGMRNSKTTQHYMSPEQSHVLDMIVKQKKSVFFTGSAGTGKSVLLREIITALRKNRSSYDSVAITASTGLAACNIGGVTLHSFSGIGLGKEPVDQLVKKIRRVQKTKQRWQRTKVLIIDEISMVDADLFDKLENVARQLKNDGRPFGNIQLIVTGDFFQLPPVPEGGRMAKFAFEANTWTNCIAHTILLTHIFRQKDPVFAGMLNEMRLGALSPQSVANFKKLNRPLDFGDGLAATELFPTRREVDNANNRQLMQLKTAQTETYEALDESSMLQPDQRDKLLSNCMAPRTLELRVGAQVMLVKNMDETLVNGSLGRVVAFMSEKTYAMVQEELPGVEDVLFSSQGAGDASELSAKQREVYDRYVNELNRVGSTKKYPLVQWAVADGTHRRTLMLPEAWKFELPTGELQASRKQLPLILAWALSIHKAQGQTLDRVKVDLNKVFEKGQAYVALSRATTQEGLQILNFDAKKVMAHDKVRAFYRSLQSAEDAAAASAAANAAAEATKPQTKNRKAVKVEEDNNDDDEYPDDDLEETYAPAKKKLSRFAFS
ncbi:hypothetical protein ABW21_db0209777 [Orbilia brochopaga]|nr:hypothetical protein ABW21_db0209777 [Drechslerella brochopaga]